jgi:hypothetical protein
MAYFLEFGNYKQPKYLVITTNADYPEITEWIELTGTDMAVKLLYDSDDRDFHHPRIKTSLEVEALKNNGTNEDLFDAILNDYDDNVWAYVTNGLKINDDFTLPLKSTAEYTFDGEDWTFDIDETSTGVTVTIDDWYLPAINEVETYHNNVGLSVYVDFLTSTEYDDDPDFLATIYSRIGPVTTSSSKTVSNYFFISRKIYSEEDKNIGDNWTEQGVKIYDKQVSGIGWNYSGAALYSQYESGNLPGAPGEMGDSLVWAEVYSNITDEIGATAQDLDDGLSNSIAITTQAGHTTSAALICLDYEVDITTSVPVPAVITFDYEGEVLPVICEFIGSLVMEGWDEKYSGITPVKFVFTDRQGLLKPNPFIPNKGKMTIPEILSVCYDFGVSKYLAIQWPYTTYEDEVPINGPHEYLIDVMTYGGKDKEEVLEDLADSFGLQVFCDFQSVVSSEPWAYVMDGEDYVMDGDDFVIAGPALPTVDDVGIVRARFNFYHPYETGDWYLYELTSGSVEGVEGSEYENVYELVTTEPVINNLIEVDEFGMFEETKETREITTTRAILINNDSSFRYDFKAKTVGSTNDYVIADSIIWPPEISEDYFFGRGFTGLLARPVQQYRHYYTTGALREATDFRVNFWAANGILGNISVGTTSRQYALAEIVEGVNVPGIVLSSFYPEGISRQLVYTEAAIVRKVSTTSLKLDAEWYSGFSPKVYISACAITFDGNGYKYNADTSTWGALSASSGAFEIAGIFGELASDSFEFPHPPGDEGIMYRLYFTVFSQNQGILTGDIGARLTSLKCTMQNTGNGFPTGIRIETTVFDGNRQRVESEHKFYSLPNLVGAESYYSNGIYDLDLVPRYTSVFFGMDATMLSHINYQKSVQYAFNRWLFDGTIMGNLFDLKPIYKLEDRVFYLAEGEYDLKRGYLEGKFIELYNTPEPTAPAAPSGLTAAAVSDTQIELNWRDNSDNEDNFHFQVSTDGITWTTDIYPARDVTTFLVWWLVPSTTYYFRIRAVNQVGASDWTAAVSETTDAISGDVPDAPTDLVATTASTSQIDLTWTDNSADEDGFAIWRSEGLDERPLYTQIDTVAADEVSYSDTGLKSDTEYFYFVTAYNEFGSSLTSNIDSDTTTAVVAPGVPTGLAGSEISGQRAYYTFNSSAGATGYKIKWNIDGGLSKIVDVGGVLNWTSGVVDIDKTIYVSVAAYNAGGESAYSAEVSVYIDGLI